MAKVTLRKPKKVKRKVFRKQQVETRQTRQVDQIRDAIEGYAKRLAAWLEQNPALLTTIHSSTIHPQIAAEVVSQAIDILESKGARVPAIILDSDWDEGLGQPP